MTTPTHLPAAAPRRSFVLAALLAVVAALSVDAQAVLERCFTPAAAALPRNGDAQMAIDAAWQFGNHAATRPGRAERMKIEALQTRPLLDPQGAAVQVSAQVSGGIRPRYRWDFGDGTPATDWSILHSARHRYTVPGAYMVRLTVVDDRGQHLQQVLLHSAGGTVAAAD
ncbi:PDK repeat-containing protein [Burkholderiales bacterium JOSHI_001]|nr:PDK repeat-containing protein [Burkholderiales bacterium JOSHI_001]